MAVYTNEIFPQALMNLDSKGEMRDGGMYNEFSFSSS